MDPENLPDGETEPVSGENPPVSETDVDERGVPTKQVYAEVMRKLDQFERRTAAQAAETARIKDAQIVQLQAELAAAKAGPPPKPDEEFTEEQLLHAYAQAGDRDDVKAHIIGKLTDLKTKKLEAKLSQQNQVSQQQNVYNTQASAKYPELMDVNSPFYVAVVRNVEERIRSGAQNARTVLDAANEVATMQPTLVSGRKPAPTPEPPRGWSDRSNGSPRRKPTETLIKEDDPIHKDWAQRFPGLKLDNINKRTKDIQDRLIWNQGQG
jgi:hypothetical protein